MPNIKSGLLGISGFNPKFWGIMRDFYSKLRERERERERGRGTMLTSDIHELLFASP
jgi:hypothetical protein